MANIQDPVSGAQAKVDLSFGALRISQRPVDATTGLGAYRQAAFTGAIAAGFAANAELYQFRYTGANLCVVDKLRFHGLVASTAFAAGVITLRVNLATSWTVDGTGGAVVATTTEACQLDTQYSTPVATIRCATTAALGAGTKTLQSAGANTQGLAMALGFTAPATPAVGLQMAADDLIDPDGGYNHPLILRQNEGFVIVATVPITGVWTTGFTVNWTEMLAATWR